MNKTEYMNELAKRLRHLPKDDFQKAIDYYEEYFAEAGSENEAQVIEDLGTPEFAAKQIVTNIAINNSKEPTKDVKKGLNAIWVGILAVCAAPIALPIALALVMLVVMFILTILILLAAFILTGAVFVLTGPLTVIAGCTILAKSLPVFLTCLGIGLLSTGSGLLICYGSIRLCRWFLTGMIHFFGHLAKKGGIKNEKNQ